MVFSSWRGIVGLVNPTMRPGPTEELIRLLPEGIGVIPLFLDVRRGAQDEFKTAMPAYEQKIALLAEQGCDLIIAIGAPPFMVQAGARPRSCGAGSASSGAPLSPSRRTTWRRCAC
jgi:maleate isomerase